MAEGTVEYEDLIDPSALRFAEDATSLLSRPAELSAALGAAGYLYFKALLPSEEVLELSREVSAVLAADNWLDIDKAGVPINHLVVATDRPELRLRDTYRKIFALEALHRLPHHPRMMAMMAGVLETNEVLVHPRPVCRTIFPGSPGGALATPAHQDHVGMQGTVNAYTAWMPLMNCPMDLGPLVVAAGSHRSGSREFSVVPRSRVFVCDEADLDGSWVVADFAPGDVLIFHSLTVHKALPNLSHSVRLSVDFRFQRLCDPICEVSLRDDADHPWSEVYRDWQCDEYKAYWHELPLVVAQFDHGFYERAVPGSFGRSRH